VLVTVSLLSLPWAEANLNGVSVSFDDPWGLPAPESEPDAASADGLKELLRRQAALLISVATGGPRIDSVNGEYARRRSQLATGLRGFGLEDPFPWRDLWGWYGAWSSEMPTYAQRRIHIRELALPIEDALDQLAVSGRVEDAGPVDPSSWPQLQSRLEDMKRRFEMASGMDDWQDVGRRCRELLIDLANRVYVVEMNPEGDDEPKASDAKARLALALPHLMPGSAHRELRSVVNATWDLANKVTHSGSVTEVDAFSVVQSTVLLVRLLERAYAGSAASET
jgi:hypothetical protein